MISTPLSVRKLFAVSLVLVVAGGALVGSSLAVAPGSGGLVASVPLSLATPGGLVVGQPLQFSFTVQNVSGQTLSVGRLRAAVRGPSGEGLDVLCANGWSITLASNQTWQCSAVAATGFTTVGTYTYWADWMDTSGNWHPGGLGQAQTFTLQAAGSSAPVPAPPPSSGGSSSSGGSGGTSGGSSSSGGVTQPTPPSGYPLPSGAIVVSTSGQLASALAAQSAVIVLTDGTYGGSSYFNDTGSSLYAQHAGRATLTSGLVVGGNFGSGGLVVQGLAFNVSNPSLTFANSELNIWGRGGSNTRVLDDTFEGHASIPYGLLATNPSGLVAQRLTFHAFTDGGLRATDNVAVAYGGSVPRINSISDISVDGVSRSTPGASNGTAEQGLFVGEPVTNGVQRIRVRNVSLSGIETANNSWNTTFSNLDINMSGPNQSSGVAVYMEHFTLRDTFTNFAIAGTRVGFNGEWDDGTPGNAAAHFATIQNGTVSSAGWTLPGHQAGVYLDAGTESTTVTNVTFLNQNWAGIGAYKTSGTNTFSGNTYQLAAGAVPVSTSHI